jgi:hypothetical protein
MTPEEHIKKAEEYIKDVDRIINKVLSGVQATLILSDQILINAETSAAQIHILLAYGGGETE